MTRERIEERQDGRRSSWWLRIAAAGLAVALTVVAVACGDDDEKATDGGSTPAATQAASGDEQAVQQVLLDAIGRWNAKDLAGILTFFTDEGLISSFGEGGTVEDAKAGLADFIGTQVIGNAEFSEVSASGDTASMDVVFSFGPTLTHSVFGLVKVGQEWKLNSEESNLPVEVPSGATVIEVDLNEFAFGTDTSAITEATGLFALQAKNVGKQDHMLALARVPADANIEELLQQDDPAGFEFLGSIEEIAPGSSANLVFVSKLGAGRYVMVCFLPDTDEGEDGTPHFLKGMIKEFTVE